MSDQWINLGDQSAPRLLPPADQRALAKIADVVETLTALSRSGPRAFGKLRDQMVGQPGAASYDAASGNRGRMFCWEHERDLAICQRQGGDCLGESINVNDPVGEAAMSSDGAKIERDAMVRDIDAMHRLAGKVQLRVLAHATGRRPSTLDKRDSDRNGNPGCASCARLPAPSLEQGVQRWEPPLTKAPTTVKGILSEPMLLCRVCWHYVSENGSLPTMKDLDHRHLKGVWPKQHVDPKSRRTA